ncbi:MAG TPA: PAS domain S-box protein, partial [Labilithrix sp.]|nr:PAS domain S-box protein [Labilithrix sp.]
MSSGDSSARPPDEAFRAIFDSALDAMLLADDRARYVEANPAALELLGLTLDELRQTGVHDLSPFDPAVVDGAWAAFLRDRKQEGEFELRRSDGTPVVVEFRAVANVMPGRHLSVMRDITERRKSEEIRRRLAAIVESAGDAIFGGNFSSGLLDYWSPSAERMFGYSAGEMLGQSHRMLVPQERSNEIPAIVERLARGETIRNLETVRQRKDGSRFHVSLTMSPTIEEGHTRDIFVIARDLSEKKELERRLAIADRMASIGTLAAGVAHEINNPLAYLMVNLELAATRLLPKLVARAEGAAPELAKGLAEVSHLI